MKISFCLITRDEAENLPRCLGSLQRLADEIVVVDSGSRDETLKIAGRFGARCEHQDWLGYVCQKNNALSLAAHPWIFSIDADEELSAPLQREIGQLKMDQPESGISGYSMPRCVLYEGRWIRHGDWYPDRLVRLFRKERARFAGGKVHERLVVTGGRIEALQGQLYHYSFRDAADHWDRCRHYARLWAESQWEQGRAVRPGSAALHALFRWMRGFIVRRGFLDGPQGWRIAAMNAREVHLKYRLLRQLGQETKREKSRRIR